MNSIALLGKDIAERDWLPRNKLPEVRSRDNIDKLTIVGILSNPYFGGRLNAHLVIAFEQAARKLQDIELEGHTPPWMSAVSAEGRARLNTDTLVRMIEGLGSMLRERKYSELDALLVSAPISDWAPEAMLALVRITFTARNSLKEWGSAVIRVAAELDSRGIESKKSLRGLLLGHTGLPAA